MYKIVCFPFVLVHLTFVIVNLSVHLSESVTITVFQREPAGQKGECLFNECWMNVMLVWDLFPFSSVFTLRIPISSVALCGNIGAARFELSVCLLVRFGVLIFCLFGQTTSLISMSSFLDCFTSLIIWLPRQVLCTFRQFSCFSELCV